MQDSSAGDVLHSRKTFSDLDPVDARMMIKERLGQPDFVLLDVRTPSEHELLHIPGDVVLDYHDPHFYRDLLRLPHDRTYIVYCSSGARSGRTVELMRELEFPSAFNLAGGLYNWMECGFKVEEADEL
jgi:rhodanese-related sulfurtransferase